MAGERFSTRRKKNGSGLLWGFLAVLFVVFMLKWGLPWFINILAGPSGQKVTDINTSDDIVPPQTPTLFPLPEATNSATIRIEGYTEANVEINVFRNDELAINDNSDDKGTFRVEFKLNEGENRIQVKARDSKGNESQSVIKTVIYDKQDLIVTIDSPQDGDEVFGQNNQNIPVSGKVSKPGASVTVNGNFARVDADGKYTVTIHLSQGDNDVTVKATDKAGNTAERTVKVKLTF